MAKANRSEYTALDFRSWHAQDALDITPKFQRRGVWTTPAKSYLMDTLVKGMPVPPLFLRVIQSSDKKKIVREVVDGQQRLSAVLDFIEGKFALSKTLDSPYAGRYFSKLPTDVQDSISTYPFICEVFQGISDKEVLEIFSRLNQNSVPLNDQELRNGKYFGYFKQTAYRLAYEHVGFWKLQGVFSDQKIARMLEVEFTSELLIAQIAGLQDKKKSISEYYERYDEEFPQRSRSEERFRKVMDTIGASLGDVLRDTPFRRVPIFYSLYGAIYHRMYGLQGSDFPVNKRPFASSDKENLLSAVARLSDVLAQYETDEDRLPPSLRRFAAACSKQTDNIGTRTVRTNTIYRLAFAQK